RRGAPTRQSRETGRSGSRSTADRRGNSRRARCPACAPSPSTRPTSPTASSCASRLVSRSGPSALPPASPDRGGRMIAKTDFIGVPSTDAERSRAFYVETLGLRPDDHGRFEFWAGDTCFAIWEPAKLGMEFSPQKNAHPALHVDDVSAAREQLEAKGVG